MNAPATLYATLAAGAPRTRGRRAEEFGSAALAVAGSTSAGHVAEESPAFSFELRPCGRGRAGATGTTSKGTPSAGVRPTPVIQPDVLFPEARRAPFSPAGEHSPWAPDDGQGYHADTGLGRSLVRACASGIHRFRPKHPKSSLSPLLLELAAWGAIPPHRGCRRFLGLSRWQPLPSPPHPVEIPARDEVHDPVRVSQTPRSGTAGTCERSAPPVRAPGASQPHQQSGRYSADRLPPVTAHSPASKLCRVPLSAKTRHRDALTANRAALLAHRDRRKAKAQWSTTEGRMVLP